MALGVSWRTPGSDEEIVYRIPVALRGSLGASVAVDSTTAMAQAKSALEAFSATTNPRFLGDARSALNHVEETERDAAFFLYRASYYQSLHEFAAAEADIQRGLSLQPDSYSLRLMQFNLAFVQGNYDRAAEACQALAALKSDLYSASCQQQLVAAQGKALQAYTALKADFSRALLTADPQARHWASSTLADIAERAALPEEAESLWRVTLQGQEEDIYTRSRLCQLLLLQGRDREVLLLTEEYLQIDDLAVSHGMALKALNRDATKITDALSLRFDEALWRGEILHKRAYAQFLLSLAGEPKRALEMAERNWQTQREWPDQRLLSQARAAVASK